MTDYTVLVIIQTATHNIRLGKEGARWRELESVDVFPWHGQPNGHPKHAHIHLLDCPLSIQDLKKFLLRPHLSTISTDADARIFVARCRHVWERLSATQLDRLRRTKHIDIQYADMFDRMLVRDIDTRTTGRKPSIADL